jgi:drug/metabolite transporter (DMT)-like permease
MEWSALWTVYLVWGSTYLAIRIVVETLPPLLSAGVRFVLAGLIMSLFLMWRSGASRMRVSLREVGASALIGSALLLGGNGIVTIAEQDVPSALAALIIASVPLWVVVLRALFGDRASGGTLVGVAVGFAGVGILVGSSGGGDGGTLGGVLLLVLASLSWAAGSFFSSKVALPKDPFVSTSWQMLTGGAALLVSGVALGELDGLDPSEFSRGSLLGLAYLVVFGSLLAFTAYTWLLNNAPISKVSTYAYVNPVVAVFLGWIILSETITPLMLVGAAVIVASVAFIVRHEVKVKRAAANGQTGSPQPAPPHATGAGELENGEATEGDPAAAEAPPPPVPNQPHQESEQPAPTR